MTEPIHVECADPGVLAAHQDEHGAGTVQFYDPGRIEEGWHDKGRREATGWFGEAIAGGSRYRLVFDSPEAAGEGLSRHAREGARVELQWTSGGAWRPSCGVASLIAYELSKDSPPSYRITAPLAAPEAPPEPDPDEERREFARKIAGYVIDAHLNYDALTKHDAMEAAVLVLCSDEGAYTELESLVQPASSDRPPLPPGVEAEAWSEKHACWILWGDDVPDGWEWAWGLTDDGSPDWTDERTAADFLRLARPVPQPRTEAVHWSEASLRRLPDGRLITSVRRYRGQSPEVGTDEAWESVGADGRVEVLVENGTQSDGDAR